MRNSLRVLCVALGLSLAVPGVSWAANALIVHDGTAGIEADALANLTTHLTGKGFVVTPNVGVPGGSLATFQQIWDIRFNNAAFLTPGDITAYQTYLSGGGSLFVMGENLGFATRNNSIVALVSALGGGTITLTTPANTEIVRAPFTGPTPLATITYLAASGVQLSSGSGNGTAITKDVANIAAAVVWGPGQLSAAPAGVLIAVFDVNFMQAGASADSQALIDNLISYLLAPFVSTPALPTITSISPTTGPVTGGTTVSITGNFFTGATTVNFGATLAPSFTVVTPTLMTATSPAGTGTVDITVTTPGGTSITNPVDGFTYTAAVPTLPQAFAVLLALGLAGIGYFRLRRQA